MKPKVMVIALLLALAVVLGCAAATAATASAGPSAPDGRYLVVFKSSTLPSDAARRVVNSGGKVVRSFQQIGVVSAIGDASFVGRMARDAKVLSVGREHMFNAPDGKVVEFTDEFEVPEAAPSPVPEVDTFYTNWQWDIRRVGAPAVWARLPLSAATPRVALLDVGVKDNHPDLVGQVDTSVATSYCPTGDGYPTYTTYIDFDTYPNWTPADGCTPLGFTDYEGHGTHVAGTIAAKFGGGRAVGVAPDAKIGAYKVFDIYAYQGKLYVGAFDSPIFAAIIDATLEGYRVISLSLGSYGIRNDKDYNSSWLAWDRVAKWANRNGTLIVASAGNTPVSLNGTLFHIPSDLPTVVSTSATATSQLEGSYPGPFDAAPGSDFLASYSSYGAAVDIAAPGGDCPPSGECYLGPYGYPIYWIMSDYIGGTGTSGYAWATGTSMATPHVSAVAAWVFATHPYWTPGDVRSWLKTTAEAIDSRQRFGSGMVNADAATR
jgi:lantibiotic leader peptide-processing serine protease